MPIIVSYLGGGALLLLLAVQLAGFKFGSKYDKPSLMSTPTLLLYLE